MPCHGSFQKNELLFLPKSLVRHISITWKQKRIIFTLKEDTNIPRAGQQQLFWLKKSSVPVICWVGLLSAEYSVRPGPLLLHTDSLPLEAGTHCYNTKCLGKLDTVNPSSVQCIESLWPTASRRRMCGKEWTACPLITPKTKHQIYFQAEKWPTLGHSLIPETCGYVKAASRIKIAHKRGRQSLIIQVDTGSLEGQRGSWGVSITDGMWGFHWPQLALTWWKGQRARSSQSPKISECVWL